MEKNTGFFGAYPEVRTGDISLQEDGHCDRLTWFFQEDNDPDDRVKGEPYCNRCPRISLIGTHCCLNRNCEEQIKEAKKKFAEQWNKFHPDRPVKVENTK